MIIKISGKNLRIKNNLDKPDIPTALSLNCEKAFKKSSMGNQDRSTNWSK